MTPRISKAIDIFLDALNKGLLASGTCACCAVGNLVAAAMGYKPVLYPVEPMIAPMQKNEVWIRSFQPNIGPGELHPKYRNISLEEANKAIEATDFTLKELKLIESAFEANTHIPIWLYAHKTPEEIRVDQINGLEAVVKVMLEFDKQPDEVREVFTVRAEALVLS